MHSQKRRKLLCLMSSLALSASLLTALPSFAANIISQHQQLRKNGMLVSGSMPLKIKLNNGKDKIIRLMQIRLSQKNSQKLSENLTQILQSQNLTAAKTNLPERKYIGMNREPVLDQGEWGTCATFATTGAIDALYPLQDNQRISQLCNLELGRTLDNPPGAEGGWNGSFGYIILNQINKYGYLTLQYQHKRSCGGLTEYPAYSSDNGEPMSKDDFWDNSIKDFTKNDWTPLLSYDGRFSPIDPDKAKQVLMKVKEAINAGIRVTFGTILDPYVGQAGAVGSYRGYTDDVWVMTRQIKADVASGQVAGHEIIIDGYDDHACATYEEHGSAKKQCGLFRIRNSWSDKAGNHGDYYMSYQHFMGMVVEAYGIGMNAKTKLNHQA